MLVNEISIIKRNLVLKTTLKVLISVNIKLIDTHIVRIINKAIESFIVQNVLLAKLNSREELVFLLGSLLHISLEYFF